MEADRRPALTPPRVRDHAGLRGVEALLRVVAGAGYPPERGVHATYAVLIDTIGFVGWEIPRTRRQPAETYAARWRQVAAGLQASDFPLTSGTVDELGQVAGDEPFDLGLLALTRGLTSGS